MTPDLIELGKRAVACKGWWWMPGMLATDGVAVAMRIYSDGQQLMFAVNVPGWEPSEVGSEQANDCLPVLNDPATLGCLLALVREAWGDPEMHLALGASGWVWLSGESRIADVVLPIPAGRTEAEALVVALESAP